MLKVVLIFMCIQLSEAEAAPTSEDMDTPCGHLQEGLCVCACQSGVRLIHEAYYTDYIFFFCTSYYILISLLSLKGSLVFGCHLLSWTG